MMPVAFKVAVRRGQVEISAIKQSPRGTRYLAGRQLIDTMGKSREQFQEDVLAAIEALAPGYPKNN
jgi:hypothetical protein